MARRLLLGSGVIGGLIAAAVIAYAAYTALQSPLAGSPNTSSVSENCSPGPCANLSGYQLWISNVRIEGTVVHMTVKFQNSSPSTHASPDDLQLIDSARHSSTPATDIAGCSTWTRHEFSHRGESFGPIDICFQVIDPTPPLILKWSPDEGAFCCETDIKIDAS